MSSFSIQFHAKLEELAALVETWRNHCGAYATAITFAPFSAEALAEGDANDRLLAPVIRRIMFTERPPKLGATSSGLLLDQNAGALLLDIGRLSPRGLAESRLHTMQANPTWKRMARLLRERTHAGAVGVHDQTGARAFYRDHRYSDGARSLFESGVVMRPFDASPVVLEFGQPGRFKENNK
jgi:hypothetical protein